MSRGLLGRPDWLEYQSRLRPKLGYALVADRLGHALPRIGGEAIGCGLDGWQTINFLACFNGTDSGQCVDIEACDDLPCLDLWLYAIDWTIWRPNWGQGSLLKGQDDWGLKNVTYVTVDSFRIKGICVQEIGNGTPLENFGTEFDWHCPAGIILPADCLRIDGKLCLNRPLAEEEVPFEVRITLHVLALGIPWALTPSNEEAIAGLQKLGILPGRE